MRKQILLTTLILTWLMLAPSVCLAALQPGSGFSGETTEPGPVGTPGEEGYDAKAIARWDVVPYQTFTSTMEIGVVAFHMVGIDRVEFSVEGGPWQAVSQASVNPRTAAKEYWDVLDANDCVDGLIELRAIAYPTIGQPRLLESLYLYANAGGSLPEGNTVYVNSTSDVAVSGISGSISEMEKFISADMNASGLIVDDLGTSATSMKYTALQGSLEAGDTINVGGTYTVSIGDVYVRGLSGARYIDTGDSAGDYVIRQTGAFECYQYAPGQQITITAPENLTGTYTIAAKVDDNTIRLALRAGDGVDSTGVTSEPFPGGVLRDGDFIKGSLSSGSGQIITGAPSGPLTYTQTYGIFQNGEEISNLKATAVVTSAPQWNNDGRTINIDSNPIANGDDANPGTIDLPMRTITKALPAAGDGGKIIILEEGLYELGSSSPRLFDIERYLQVEPAAGLNRDNVIIGWPVRQQSRSMVAMIHWKGVSFDFSTIQIYYLDAGCYAWFDNCRWFQSEGWAAGYSDLRSPLRSTDNFIYVTDSLAEDTIYGFVGVQLVRNSLGRKISGDVYQRSRMVLNCRAADIDGTVSGHHTDIYQIWGHNENIIVYGLDTENIAKAQCIFLDHANSSHTNFAFVDIYFDCFDPGGSPPATQFNAPHNHVILRNVRWPGQNILFRDDMIGEKKFTANNVLFENCELYPASYDRYVLGEYSWGRGTPEGVIFRNCYPTGEAPPEVTYGDVSENGAISATDASMTARYAVGSIGLTSEQITKADVTGNGSVSATDASWIARKAVDETIVFPVEE